MTKERKLAIEMWQNIRSKIIALDYGMGHVDIIKYKREFCKRHNLHWSLSCWFCQYIRMRYGFNLDGCKMCPLKSCEYGPYNNVLDKTLDKDERVEACDAIIKALGGEV